MSKREIGLCALSFFCLLLAHLFASLLSFSFVTARKPKYMERFSSNGGENQDLESDEVQMGDLDLHEHIGDELDDEDPHDAQEHLTDREFLSEDDEDHWCAVVCFILFMLSSFILLPCFCRYVVP